MVARIPRVVEAQRMRHRAVSESGVRHGDLERTGQHRGLWHAAKLADVLGHDPADAERLSSGARVTTTPFSATAFANLACSTSIFFGVARVPNYAQALHRGGGDMPTRNGRPTTKAHLVIRDDQLEEPREDMSWVNTTYRVPPYHSFRLIEPAQIASGWSDRRLGLAPSGKNDLVAAHPETRHPESWAIRVRSEA